MTRPTEGVWITITQLRRQFHRVLREAERGTQLTITRRGRPVARLAPYQLTG
ncbi:MAG TPA: type II toxin-antitoxin system prevent-host-death family antitoxin [Candidatus Limnocylindrales bacterium]|nr:type II toxin-antitoxin system prevent-host-death family antitoxin [Candidatus Limnocylindrales bacterium]